MTRRHAAWRWTRFAGVLLVVVAMFHPKVAACDDRTPRIEAWVTDRANVLSAEQRQRLTERLAAYEKETSHQIVVLTVPSLSGESIESFALRVANAAGIGRRGVDNGVLLMLAIAERSVRIELGLGFERHVSNDRAKAIIETMTPSFRKGDYAGGLEIGIEAVMSDGRRFVAPRDDARKRWGQRGERRSRTGSPSPNS